MVLALEQRADAVDVPADEVPAQPVADGQRPLQVHRAAGLQLAEVGAGERFRPGLEGERVALALDHRQAAAVDRDAVGHRGLGGDLRLADDQPAARRLLAQFHDRAQRFDNSRKHAVSSNGGRRFVRDEATH